MADLARPAGDLGLVQPHAQLGDGPDRAGQRGPQPPGAPLGVAGVDHGLGPLARGGQRAPQPQHLALQRGNAPVRGRQLLAPGIAIRFRDETL